MWGENKQFWAKNVHFWPFFLYVWGFARHFERVLPDFEPFLPNFLRDFTQPLSKSLWLLIGGVHLGQKMEIWGQKCHFLVLFWSVLVFGGFARYFERVLPDFESFLHNFSAGFHPILL